MPKIVIAILIAFALVACGDPFEPAENVAKVERGVCSIPGPLFLKRQFQITGFPRFITSNCPSASLPGTVRYFSLPLSWPSMTPWTPPNSDTFWTESPAHYTSTWINNPANGNLGSDWWNVAPEHYCAPYTERVTAEWLMVEISPLPLKTRHVNTVHWWPGDNPDWDMNPPNYYHGYDYGTAQFVRSTTWPSGQKCSQRWEFDWIGVEPSF